MRALILIYFKMQDVEQYPGVVKFIGKISGEQNTKVQ